MSVQHKWDWLNFYSAQGLLIHPHHYRLPSGHCSCTLVPWNESKTCTYEVGGHPVRKYAEITDVPRAYEQTAQELRRDPGINFAMRTGSCSGIIAIDVDVKDGKNGLKSLDELGARLGLTDEDFLHTAHARTGSGGFHFLFQAPADGELIRNTQSALGPHLDVRGENGYILVSPSAHKRTGRLYEWLVPPFRQNIKPLPPALLSELRRTQGASTSNPTPRTIVPPPSRQEMVSWARTLKARARTRATGEILLAALQGEPFPFPRGTGNESFFKLAIDIAEGWPNNHPAGLVEHLREAIEKRQAQGEGTTSVQEVIDLVDREQVKLYQERTGVSSKWRYGKEGYLRDDNNRPKSTPANAAIAFRHHPAWKDVLAYDVRTQRAVFMKAPPFEMPVANVEYPMDLGNAANMAMLWLQREEGISLQPSHVRVALVTAAMHNPVNPVKEWLENLPEWDGTRRISGLLQHIGGVQDTDWARACQKRWFISLVARMLNPGCKVDTMLILQGDQGFKKSSFFQNLMPSVRWFSDSLRTPDLAESTIRQLHSGPVLFEIAEMQGFKSEAIANIKAFLAATQDQLRPLYEDHKPVPRGFVVVGTTNDDHFLHDATGGRRFWPLRINSRIRIGDLVEMREQLFAEALFYYKNGEKWWLTKEEETWAVVEQEERYERHVLHDKIVEWLHRRVPDGQPQVATPIASPDRVTTSMIFDAMKDSLEGYQGPKLTPKVICSILRQEGWKLYRPSHSEVRMSGSSRKRYYVRPGSM